MAEKFRVMFAGLEAGVDQAHATEQLAAKLKIIKVHTYI
mgnify:CR=1 FL=1